MIRDCDHIFEKLFGYDVFVIKDGCHNFQTTINDVEEKGTYCYCEGDYCNGGDVAPPTTTTTTTTTSTAAP